MGKTILCHCEDIALDELFSALRQGYGEIESLKRYTGIGTGKCQGKCCLAQTLQTLSTPEAQSAIRAGALNGPGEPLGGVDAVRLEDAIRIPTIRQPVIPMRIDDIVDAGDPGDQK